MSGAGGRSASPWGRSRPWRLAGFALLVLCAWLSAPQPAHSQSQSTTPSSTEELLLDSLAASARVRQIAATRNASQQDLETAYADFRLKQAETEAWLRSEIDRLKAESKASSEESQRENASLQTRLTDSVTRSEALEAKIQSLTDSLTASIADSAQVSKLFEDYKRDRDADILRLTIQRNLWAAGAVGCAVLAVVAGIWAVTR